MGVSTLSKLALIARHILRRFAGIGGWQMHGARTFVFTTAVVVLCGIGSPACALVGAFANEQAEPHDYPSPPQVGTAQQQARLAEVARAATSEEDDDERATLLVELASQMWSMLPERYADDDYDELARFVVETALISFHERQHRPDAARPEVQVLPKKAPQELVALRITQSGHWTIPAARLMSTSSAAADALDSAGVFDRNGQGAGLYEHAAIFFNEENIQRLEQGELFDPFVRRLYTRNRLAAARLCLSAGRVGAPLPAEARALENRRLTAILHEVHEVELLVLRREDLRYLGAKIAGSQVLAEAEQQAIAELNEPIHALLRLARHPDWGVHLYILSVIGEKKSWQTPELLETIRAHQNPISLRFFRNLPIAESTTTGARLDVEGS